MSDRAYISKDRVDTDLMELDDNQFCIHMITRPRQMFLEQFLNHKSVQILASRAG